MCIISGVTYAAHRRNLALLENFLTDLRPGLEQVLRRYEIPSGDACWLLEETVLELIYRGEGAEEPTAWLLSKLRHKCRKYWVDQHRRVAQAVMKVFPGAS